jgi:A/G-specific adenine glycosylase
MLRNPDLTEFRAQLLGWFRRHRRNLPWRLDKDPYRIWLSEIMLQQTRVAAVIPYYERFLEHFPSIRALAEAPEEEVLRLWSGLGYYSRARNLRRAAQQIVTDHEGEFPGDIEAALALPGIGSYTAAAILSIAFGAEYAVLDGNVARVIARLDAVRGDLREVERWGSLQQTADRLLDPKSPSDWNQAVMELGAMVCTPRSPQCLVCPIAESCRARQLGLTDVIPEKRLKRATEEVTLAAAVILDRSGEALLLPPPHAARKHATHEDVIPLVSKMWHFPTIAVQQDPKEELCKFLREDCALGASNGSLQLEALTHARHTVTYRAIKLLPYRVLIPRLPMVSGAKSLPLAALVSRSSLAVSNLTRKIAQAALAEVVDK